MKNIEREEKFKLMKEDIRKIKKAVNDNISLSERNLMDITSVSKKCERSQRFAKQNASNVLNFEDETQSRLRKIERQAYEIREKTLQAKSQERKSKIIYMEKELYLNKYSKNKKN